MTRWLQSKKYLESIYPNRNIRVKDCLIKFEMEGDADFEGEAVWDEIAFLSKPKFDGGFWTLTVYGTSNTLRTEIPIW